MWPLHIFLHHSLSSTLTPLILYSKFFPVKKKGPKKEQSHCLVFIISVLWMHKIFEHPNWFYYKWICLWYAMVILNSQTLQHSSYFWHSSNKIPENWITIQIVIFDIPQTKYQKIGLQFKSFKIEDHLLIGKWTIQFHLYILGIAVHLVEHLIYFGLPMGTTITTLVRLTSLTSFIFISLNIKI